MTLHGRFLSKAGGATAEDAQVILQDRFDKAESSCCLALRVAFGAGHFVWNVIDNM